MHDLKNDLENWRMSNGKITIESQYVTCYLLATVMFPVSATICEKIKIEFSKINILVSSLTLKMKVYDDNTLDENLQANSRCPLDASAFSCLLPLTFHDKRTNIHAYVYNVR